MIIPQNLLIAVTSANQGGLIKLLGHHQLLLVLLELALLLLIARGLGEFMRRIKLPPVVGELLAGVLLGLSVFGWLLLNIQEHLFPHNQAQSDLLAVVSWLGVLFLLIVTGLAVVNLIFKQHYVQLQVPSYF